MLTSVLTNQNRMIRDNFDAIARRYDLTNRVISFGIDVGWRKFAVRQLGDLPAGARVLDLACGTFDMTLELLRRRPGTRVVGVDLSLDMLAHGRPKLIRTLGSDGAVRVVNAPAERLPFEDGSFDAAMIAFGIRNVPDFPRGLRELLRVLRPGGRLCVLEFSQPPSRLFASVYHLYFFHVLPRIGGVITGRPEAYRYLTNSVSKFPDADEFRAAMERAGFAEVRYRRLTGGIVCVHTGEHPPDPSGKTVGP
ncbi:MAG: class I SAM-dependent methyltransferase [Acidobacteriota bacterium]|jgi:demethylmenaquinone methyltransferase/2-methoxy-6-polyprenyl-1,4-benzoquinol methylase